MALTPSRRTYHSVEQDDLRHSGKRFRSSGLLAIHGVGIPLGCGFPLDLGPFKLWVESCPEKMAGLIQSLKLKGVTF